jgi:tRNA(Ile)-lysidine synthase
MTPASIAGIAANSRVLIALSGGADSVTLLDILSKQAARDGFEIVAAHVNHHLRGKESDRDARFCAKIAGNAGIELEMLDADVLSLAKEQGKGIEETAREVRYAFFAEVMEKRGISLLVTAHHATDNLETVLFRLCRGTGLRGLCGISPVRAFGKGFLVRPLLPYSKTEILDYCKENGLEFVTDSTNADTVYARNRIRSEVLPPLGELCESPEESVRRMTEGLREDLDFLESEAERFLEERGNPNKLSRAELSALHVAVRRRVWMKFLPVTPERVHLCALEELIKNGKSGASVSLAQGWQACLQRGILTLLPPTVKKSLPEKIPFVTGETVLCDGALKICVKKLEKNQSRENVHTLSTPMCIMIDGLSDVEKSGLYWRGRREGDTILFRSHHRSLRKLYRDAGIPPALRDVMPILCDEEGILWAPSVGLRDGVGNQGSDRYEISVMLADLAD